MAGRRVGDTVFQAFEKQVRIIRGAKHAILNCRIPSTILLHPQASCSCYIWIGWYKARIDPGRFVQQKNALLTLCANRAEHPIRERESIKPLHPVPAGWNWR